MSGFTTDSNYKVILDAPNTTNRARRTYWMIPSLGWEHSHGKTQYIPGKQVLVRSWLWKTNKHIFYERALPSEIWWEMGYFFRTGPYTFRRPWPAPTTIATLIVFQESSPVFQGKEPSYFAEKLKVCIATMSVSDAHTHHLLIDQKEKKMIDHQFIKKVKSLFHWMFLSLVSSSLK